MSRLYLSNPCAFFFYHRTRCCGCNQRPAFPAPSHQERDNEDAKLRRNRVVRILAVVPAKAGTHNHRMACCEGWSHSEPVQLSPVVMGPGLRRDDTFCRARPKKQMLRYLNFLPHRRADQLDAARADQMRELDHRAVGTGLRQADAVLAADHL